jgi:hypothetical protein
MRTEVHRSAGKREKKHQTLHGYLSTCFQLKRNNYTTKPATSVEDFTKVVSAHGNDRLYQPSTAWWTTQFTQR